MARKGLQKTSRPEITTDLGFGSDIFFIEYKVNGIHGRTSMCPNAAELFWPFLKEKHGIKRIYEFEYKILKNLGKSSYY